MLFSFEGEKVIQQVILLPFASFFRQTNGGNNSMIPKRTAKKYKQDMMSCNYKWNVRKKSQSHIRWK